MANEKKPAAPDLGAFSGLEPLDAASCDKLDRIRKLVDNEDDPGDYPDDVYSLSGGNIDDAFSVGLSYGEALFAESVRKILDA